MTVRKETIATGSPGQLVSDAERSKTFDEPRNIIIDEFQQNCKIYLYFYYCFFFFLLIWEFFTSALADGFFFSSFSDSRSTQIFRTVSMQADLNNVVLWMVSTYPQISKSFNPSTNSLVTLPSAPITISITVTFMFSSFFSSLVRSRNIYISFLLHSVFLCDQMERQSPIFDRFTFSSGQN